MDSFNKTCTKHPNQEKKLIVIDTETTGLFPYWDEILQLSIIDGSGNTLFNSYFKPKKRKRWPEAQRVNNITPQMVADKPHITDREILDQIQSLIDSADVIVGYNVDFDISFLLSAGFSVYQEEVDVMLEFAKVYGEWSDYFEDYKWQKLTTCARYYGYDWGAYGDTAHDSLADCRATLYCYKKIHNEE